MLAITTTKARGRTIDFGGVQIDTPIRVVHDGPKHASIPGVTIRNLVMTAPMTLVNCSQCEVSNVRFLGDLATLKVVNSKSSRDRSAWSENLRFSALAFVGCSVAMAWEGEGSFARPHVEDIFLSDCIDGLRVTGNVYGGSFQHVRGNFSDRSRFAILLRGFQRGTSYYDVNFEGGADDTVLIVNEIDHPNPDAQPIIENDVYMKPRPTV